MKRNVFLGVMVLVTAAIPALGDYVYEGQWGSLGSGEGQFNWPIGIALAPNGNIYVADKYNHRIQYFTWNGSFRGSWGTYGTGDGNFSHPEGVTVTPNGNVYVADTQNDRV
jgi:tripartite motif-containing protein 71